MYLANEYLDNVLTSMRTNRSLQAVIDPLPVPEFGEKYFTITNGQVLGLSSFLRGGNSGVQYAGDTVIVSAPVVVNNVLFTGQHKASRFGITIDGDIEAKVDNVRSLLLYRAPRKGGEARLDSFQV